jgi:hypothetical protein
MKLRLLITSVLIAVVAVFPAWLTFQPLLKRAQVAGDWAGISRVLLVSNFVLAALLIYLVLHFTVGRPVQRIGRVKTTREARCCCGSTARCEGSRSISRPSAC